MTCKRCEDIHEAQKNGKTQNKCECDCHNNTGSFTFNDYNGTLTIPCTTVDSTGVTDLTWNLTDSGATTAFASQTIRDEEDEKDVKNADGSTTSYVMTTSSSFPDLTAPANEENSDTIAYPCTCNLSSDHKCDNCIQYSIEGCTCGRGDGCDICMGKKYDKDYKTNRGESQ